MKTIIVFSAILAVAMAGLLPHVQHHGSPAVHHGVHKPEEVVLIKEVPSDNIGLDSYKFAYELSDGQKRDEAAQVETRQISRTESESVLRVRGSYSYVDPVDGQTYTVTYVADENGFQPQGAHLPVAPVA